MRCSRVENEPKNTHVYNAAVVYNYYFRTCAYQRTRRIQHLKKILIVKMIAADPHE